MMCEVVGSVQPACLSAGTVEEGAYWASIDWSGAPSEETSAQPGRPETSAITVRDSESG